MDRSTRAAADSEVDLARLGRCLIAIADPVRRRIVAELSRERLNVGDLAERLALSQPATSHHLKILSDAGILQRERNGRERLYRLDPACCRTMVAELERFVGDCCARSKCC